MSPKQGYPPLPFLWDTSITRPPQHPPCGAIAMGVRRWDRDACKVLQLRAVHSACFCMGAIDVRPQKQCLSRHVVWQPPTPHVRPKWGHALMEG